MSEEKRLIIAAYCRVSTNKDDQLNSLDNQQTYFKHKAETSNHTLFKVYADEGLTGTTAKRPEFEAMLYDAGIDIITYSNNNDRRMSKKHTIYQVSDRVPKFQEIWVKNTSRFLRNALLSFEIIPKLQDKNINIFFSEQGINTKDVGQEFLLKLFQIFDEQDSKDKSLKVTSGIAESARKGGLFTNSRLFGYTYDKQSNSLRIREDEAKTIRVIFDKYAEGYGSRRLTNFLLDEGYTTREGKPFAKTTIANILKNEKYTGQNNALKYDHGKVFHKRGFAKVRDWYEVKPSDRIDQIISIELFQKCKIMRENHIQHMIAKGKYRGVSEYAGLIICGKCGAPYYSNNDNGRRFYNCSTKKKMGIEACDNQNINLTMLNGHLQRFLDDHYLTIKIHETERIRNRIDDRIKQLKNSIDQDNIEMAKKIKNDIEVTRGKQQQLFTMWDKLSDTKVIEKNIYELDNEIKNLKTKLTEITMSNDQINTEIKRVQGLRQTIEKHIEEDIPKTVSEMIKRIKKIVIYTKADGNLNLQPVLLLTSEAEEVLNKALNFQQLEYTG